MLIANSNRDRKKQRKPFKVEDFLLRFGAPPKKPQTWKQQKMLIETMNAMMGGRDLREGRA